MHVPLAVARPYEKKSFQEYLTYLTTKVNENILRKKQVYSSERRVSSMKRKKNRPQSNCRFNDRNTRRYLRLDLGLVLHKIVDSKRVESRYYSAKDFGKLTQNQRNAIICLNEERKKLALDKQDNCQPINET